MEKFYPYEFERIEEMKNILKYTVNNKQIPSDISVSEFLNCIKHILQHCTNCEDSIALNYRFLKNRLAAGLYLNLIIEDKLKNSNNKYLKNQLKRQYIRGNKKHATLSMSQQMFDAMMEIK